MNNKPYDYETIFKKIKEDYAELNYYVSFDVKNIIFDEINIDALTCNIKNIKGIVDNIVNNITHLHDEIYDD